MLYRPGGSSGIPLSGRSEEEEDVQEERIEGRIAWCRTKDEGPEGALPEPEMEPERPLGIELEPVCPERLELARPRKGGEVRPEAYREEMKSTGRKGPGRVLVLAGWWWSARRQLRVARPMMRVGRRPELDWSYSEIQGATPKPRPPGSGTGGGAAGGGWGGREGQGPDTGGW